MMKSHLFLLRFGVIMMLVGGILIPFLMVIKVIESTYFLNFFSWGISTLGLALGMVGFTMYSKTQK
ncbi:MAG TPA: hypothetical protein DCY14_01700 [Anaerolineae bacterium]|nr:hypothetical protein [Anaerolineae bacterium]HRJ57487.1 hypothetical protein [Anaerolineales bacterium]